jgi:hypothetical protein
MRAGGQGETGPSGRDIGLLLVAAGGLAGCITLIFLGMRAVMDIGGACASGGPFVPVQPCPDGVDLLMVLGIFGLFGFGGLGLYAGSQVGGAWVALPLLAWPGLFLSLGWNFLEYGLWPPGQDAGWEWGWLVPGVLFVLMGGVPLLIAWHARREFGGPDSATRIATTFGLPVTGGQSVRVSYGWHPEHRQVAEAGPVVESDAGPDGVAGVGGGAGGDLVDRLERLADLRRSGDITNEEFEAAKAALIASTWKDPRTEGTS